MKNPLEQNPLDFSSENNENHNHNISVRELLDSLNKAFEVLLDIYNEIRNGADFPSQRRQATIIPIPKVGENLSDSGNYRPVSLTSCICKTFERMVNTRLIWYLEYHSLSLSDWF